MELDEQIAWLVDNLREACLILSQSSIPEEADEWRAIGQEIDQVINSIKEPTCTASSASPVWLVWRSYEDTADNVLGIWLDGESAVAHASLVAGRLGFTRRNDVEWFQDGYPYNQIWVVPTFIDDSVEKAVERDTDPDLQ